MNTSRGTCLTTAQTIAGLFLYLGLAAFSGCERKEKILDIETPRREVEVERSTDTGDVDVEVNKK